MALVDSVSKLVRYTLGAAMSPIHAGEEKIQSKKIHAPQSLGVSSLAFGDGQPIPSRHSANGGNISVPLSWTGVPAEAREVVLICEDPDAPKSQPFVHWIVHRIPPRVSTLPEGLKRERELMDVGGAVQGVNSAKERGYFGPRPPLGHGVHRYHFQVFALDAQLGLGPDVSFEELTHAMRGHVIAEGETVGTFETTE